MFWDLERFAQLRPFLTHLTLDCNLDAILDDRELRPAGDLIRASGRLEWLTRRRPADLPLTIPDPVLGERRVLVRDQIPLRPERILFEPGWTLEHFVARLNAMVFLWPATSRGPVTAGRRQIACYARRPGPQPLLIWMDTRLVFALNDPNRVRLTTVNSGAPPVRGGRLGPRGDTTFHPLATFPGPPSRVVEVAFEGPLRLPETARIEPVVATRISRSSCSTIRRVPKKVRATQLTHRLQQGRRAVNIKS